MQETSINWQERDDREKAAMEYLCGKLEGDFFHNVPAEYQYSPLAEFLDSFQFSGRRYIAGETPCWQRETGTALWDLRPDMLLGLIKALQQSESFFAEAADQSPQLVARSKRLLEEAILVSRIRMTGRTLSGEAMFGLMPQAFGDEETQQRYPETYQYYQRHLQSLPLEQLESFLQNVPEQENYAYLIRDLATAYVRARFYPLYQGLVTLHSSDQSKVLEASVLEPREVSLLTRRFDLFVHALVLACREVSFASWKHKIDRIDPEALTQKAKDYAQEFGSLRTYPLDHPHIDLQDYKEPRIFAEKLGDQALHDIIYIFQDNGNVHMTLCAEEDGKEDKYGVVIEKGIKGLINNQARSFYRATELARFLDQIEKVMSMRAQAFEIGGAETKEGNPQPENKEIFQEIDQKFWRLSDPVLNYLSMITDQALSGMNRNIMSYHRPAIQHLEDIADKLAFVRGVRALPGFVMFDPALAEKYPQSFSWAAAQLRKLLPEELQRNIQLAEQAYRVSLRGVSMWQLIPGCDNTRFAKVVGFLPRYIDFAKRLASRNTPSHLQGLIDLATPPFVRWMMGERG